MHHGLPVWSRVKKPLLHARPSASTPLSVVRHRAKFPRSFVQVKSHRKKVCFGIASRCCPLCAIVHHGRNMISATALLSVSTACKSQTSSPFYKRMVSVWSSCRRFIRRAVASRSPINLIMVFATLYLGLISLLMFCERWTLIEVLYYSSALVTTVGFGDYTPSSAASKCVTILLLITTLLGLAKGFEITLAGAAQNVRLKDNLVNNIFDWNKFYQQNQRRKKRRTCVALCIFVVFLVVTSCIVKLTMGLQWVDSLYFSTILVTTVGLGDFVPTSPASKLCISLIMLIGVPLFGRTVSALVLYLGHERRARLHKVDHLDTSKLTSLMTFCEYMREKGVYQEDSGHHHKINKFEFLCWVLVRSQIVEVGDLSVILRNFDALDKTLDGDIDENDTQ